MKISSYFNLLEKKHNRSTVWSYALLWLGFEIIISARWLKRIRYGPAEWILRQFTYWKRLPLTSAQV